MIAGAMERGGPARGGAPYEGVIASDRPLDGKAGIRVSEEALREFRSYDADNDGVVRLQPAANGRRDFDERISAGARFEAAAGDDSAKVWSDVSMLGGSDPDGDKRIDVRDVERYLSRMFDKNKDGWLTSKDGYESYSGSEKVAYRHLDAAIGAARRAANSGSADDLPASERIAELRHERHEAIESKVKNWKIGVGAPLAFLTFMGVMVAATPAIIRGGGSPTITALVGAAAAGWAGSRIGGAIGSSKAEDLRRPFDEQIHELQSRARAN